MQTIIRKVRESRQLEDEDIHCMDKYIRSLPKGLHVDSTVGHLLNHTFENAQRHLEEGGFQSALLDLVNSPEHIAALRSLQNKTRKKSVLLVFDTLESFRVFQPYMVEGLQGILEAINAFLANPKMSGVYVKFFIPLRFMNK